MFRKAENWVIILIFAFEGALFYYDTHTPIGNAEYLFHFLAVVAALFSRKPAVPMYAAIFAALFCVAGYFLSPDGPNKVLAFNNRMYAVTMFLITGYMVRRILLSQATIAGEAWLKNGVARLAETIRGEQTVETLSQNALKFLSQYLGASVAVMYVRGEEKMFIRRAGYAFSPDESQLPETFTFGEGALGQAARDQSILTIETETAAAIKLRTGLAVATPRRIVISPFVVDEKTSAVIEFGFFNGEPQLLNQLLESISETLAIGLRSAQHKARLNELLQDARRQGEELLAQQEELRVMNEELAQQTHTLQESQTRLENQQAEMEQTNHQLYEQSRALEEQKDALDKKNSELIEIQTVLHEKAVELEKASQYKSEFLANMSHELRTPLNSSLILAKLLADNKDGRLSDEQVRFAQTIYASGNDLLTLINDILDLSKIEAGKVDVRPAEVSMPEVKRSLLTMFEGIAKQKKINWTVEIDSNAPDLMVTDRQRLEQILKNFLSNAFKFTDHGHVTLKIFKRDGRIAFAVSDSGIGVAADKLKTIFDAFQQADSATTRKYGGTGLGLSISRELARLLGGDIELQSEVGSGSTFTLLLPPLYEGPVTNATDVSLDELAPDAVAAHETSLANASAFTQTPLRNASTSHLDASFASQTTVRPTGSVEKTTPLASRRNVLTIADDRLSEETSKKKILIIEDDARFSEILLNLAHEMDFLGIVAGTADDGIKLAKEYRPDAVVLDIRLPDHSGLAVLDYLKLNPATRHIPVHIISGEDVSQVSYRMGAIGYLLKPVKREQIQKAFSDLEQKMEQNLKKVLVIEDDPIQADSLLRLITDRKVEVVIAHTAQDALKMLGERTFDVMIMDLTLPDFSGLELLEKLSAADSPFSYPPVIVYTGRDLSEKEEAELRRYSESIIIKGARSPERLLSEVTLFLHRVEADLPLERQKMLKELRNREQALEGREILIVDDDVRNIFALSSGLESEGAKVVIARNGREALEMLEKNSKIELVLMDIMMPEMDGYEAMTLIRKKKEWAKLPIIAVTAKAMRTDQERCIQAGANDYLSKPIDMDKLLSLVRVWISYKRNF